MKDQSVRSGADILAAHVGEDGKPVRRTAVAHICMRPDLIDEWHKANDELAERQTEDAGKQRLGTGGVSKETKAAAERVRQIEEKIDAADEAFTFEKIGKTRYSEICEEHPPREGNQLDMMVGYNREAVDNAVALESLVDPVFESCTKKACKHESCGTWEALLRFLGPGEWQVIADAVREVNEAVTTTPKSVLASRVLDRAASGSRQRARGA